MRKVAEEKLFLVQNLEDAGCDESIIERYFKLQEEGRRKEQFRLLFKHRTYLLEQMHVSQRMIDCLDYLIYEMKKEQI